LWKLTYSPITTTAITADAPVASSPAQNVRKVKAMMIDASISLSL